MKITITIDGLYPNQTKPFSLVAEVSYATPTEGVAVAVEELTRKVVDEVFYIRTGRTLTKTEALKLRTHLAEKGVEMNPDPNLAMR